MKKVIFRAPHRWGSSLNRGEEISAHIQSIGHNSVYYDSSILGSDNKLPENISDSIVVFLKFPVQSEFETLKRNNNKIILDVIDCIANKDYDLETMCTWPWDGMILPTEGLAFRAKELKPDMEVDVLYHHWDKKHLQNVEQYKKQEYKFRLGYIGSPAGHFYQENIENLISVYEWEKMTTTSPYYTCHYSVRPENDLQFLYKPNTKISVAAAVGANAVHSKDLSLKYILPEDYPYLTDADLESVQKTAKYAEETFDSEIWHQGLAMMEELKERTSIERIAGIDYVKYFERF